MKYLIKMSLLLGVLATNMAYGSVSMHDQVKLDSDSSITSNTSVTGEDARDSLGSASSGMQDNNGSEISDLIIEYESYLGKNKVYKKNFLFKKKRCDFYSKAYNYGVTLGIDKDTVNGIWQNLCENKHILDWVNTKN